MAPVCLLCPGPLVVTTHHSVCVQCLGLWKLLGRHQARSECCVSVGCSPCGPPRPAPRPLRSRGLHKSPHSLLWFNPAREEVVQGPDCRRRKLQAARGDCPWSPQVLGGSPTHVWLRELVNVLIPWVWGPNWQHLCTLCPLLQGGLSVPGRGLC